MKSAGKKRGRGQRTHDKWLLALHHRCHGQFTDSSGHFREWNNDQRDDWERSQVAEMRRLYAAEFPDEAEAMLAIPDARAVTVPSARPRDAARERVCEEILDWAAQRRFSPELVQLFNDLVNDLRAGG